MSCYRKSVRCDNNLGLGISYRVLPIDGVSSTNKTSSSSGTSTRAIVTPVSTALSRASQHFMFSQVSIITIPVRTISSHMACVTTDATDDVGGEVALLWAVVFAVTNLSTVLASLVLIVTKSTVECGKLTKLVALELVLAFGNRSSLHM